MLPLYLALIQTLLEHCTWLGCPPTLERRLRRFRKEKGERLTDWKTDLIRGSPKELHLFHSSRQGERMSGSHFTRP